MQNQVVSNALTRPADAVQFGSLLRGLVSSLTEVRHDTGELLGLAVSALNHGADRADILAVAGEIDRPECPRNDDRHPERPAAWGDPTAPTRRRRSLDLDDQVDGVATVNAESGLSQGR